MLEEADNILDGMEVIMEQLGLEDAYIGIEENKMDAIKYLDKCIAERGVAGRINTFKLLSRYPKGAERVMVYEITGTTMNAGVLPADLGIILTNVTTVAKLGQYLKDGIPLTTKRVTVDGSAVNTPKNVIVPIGTPIKDVIEFCGGYSQDAVKIIMGGPMMGKTVFSDDMQIMKNTNALLVFGQEEAVLPKETACIGCGRCTVACPFNLMPAALANAYDARDAEKLDALRVMQCMEFGSCSYICPARRPLAFINKLGKSVVKEAQNGK